MKEKIIVIILILSLSWLDSYLFSEEIDYSKLFGAVKRSISSVEIVTDKAPLIEDNQELEMVLKNGLNSFNVLAPYTKMKKDIKTLVSELANYKFTLRSPKSIEIYQKTVHATVFIITPEIGSGAGFVIDKTRGLIVTNFHITRGLKNLFVAFYNKNVQDPSKLKFYPASVLRYSAKKDIAILRLTSLPYNIQELYFERTKKINVGEDVHTIGHPLSLIWTYSRGLITAVRDRFRFGEEEVADVIQIDASISPGNSGGPLLNNYGNVIGMVTFSTSSQYAQNLNFAVSSKDIKSILAAKKNEDTSISTTLQKLYGKQLYSLRDVLQGCKAYRVDENRDGETDYISIVNSKTNKEEFRYLKEVEYEIESGKKAPINILCMDISEDGIMDIFMMDFDLDTIFDAIMIDIDFDEQPDIIGIDTEGKGQITQAWILK